MSDRALIVVPTYNERDNVAQVVERFLAAAPSARTISTIPATSAWPVMRVRIEVMAARGRR